MNLNDIYKYQENTKEVTSIQFSILKDTTVKKGSVMNSGSSNSISVELYDNSEPKRGGLLDPRMGVSDRHSICQTCKLKATDCPGHFGHLILEKPLFHSYYIKPVKDILNCICLKCSKILINKKNKDAIIKISKMDSNRNRLKYLIEATKNAKECSKYNNGCMSLKTKITNSIDSNTRFNYLKSKLKVPGKDSKKSSDDIVESLYPEECYNILRNISDSDAMLLGFQHSRPENMITKTIIIPPVPIRPSVKADFFKAPSAEDDVTGKLIDIVSANKRLVDKKKNSSGTEDKNELSRDYVMLNYTYTTYIDNKSTNQQSEKRGRPTKSLSDRLKGKDGRFRENLQGKRVNFCSRTVITPNPSIEIDEIFIPLKSAKILTKPVKVTPNNIDQLKLLVRNGRDRYPGANFVFQKHRNGKSIHIDLRFGKDTVELRYGDIVERHIINGDYVLVNRQPSLHKLSMMGHRVHVALDTSINSFGLNPAATTPYNADFDGDEMNIHLPQEIPASYELRTTMNIVNQMIAPKNSAPAYGIIQDGTLGSYNMTNKDVIIDWKDAMELLAYTELGKDYIVKKNSKVTGHNLFSYIIPNNINLDIGNLVIEKGQLIKGQIVKKLIGAGKKRSLIHLIWNEYGPKEAKLFIDNLQRITNAYNMLSGFTVGVQDAIISDDIKERIRKFIAIKKNQVVHMNTAIENNPDLYDPILFEAKITMILNDIRNNVTDLIMENLPKDNNFDILISSGAKGAPNNMGQIAGSVGLQITDGKRLDVKVNGRTLSCYHKNDNSAIATGLAENSFMRGLSYYDFNSHVISGRQGLVQKTIGVSETGYMQRRLVKASEDGATRYDLTVRNSKDIILQFIYGDNGFDTKYILTNEIKTLVMGDQELKSLYLFNKSEMSKYKFSDQENKKQFDDFIKLRDILRPIMINYNLNYTNITTTCQLPFDIITLISNIKNRDNDKKYVSEQLSPKYIIKKLEEMLLYSKTSLICMDDEDAKNKESLKNQDEQKSKLIFKYALYQYLSPKICLTKLNLDLADFDLICERISAFFNRSVVSIGESVGIIAAQSGGETLSQMKLNSIDYNDKVFIYDRETKKIIAQKIGFWIDTITKDNNNTQRLSDNEKEEMGDTYYLDTSDRQYYTLSVQPGSNGNVSWNKISAVTKHLPINKDGTSDLVKITTQSGKCVTATKAKSFLIWDSDKNSIQNMRGDQIKTGMKVPIISSFPKSMLSLDVHLNIVDKVKNILQKFNLSLFDISKKLVNCSTFECYLNTEYYQYILDLQFWIVKLESFKTKLVKTKLDKKDIYHLSITKTDDTILFDAISKIEIVQPTHKYVYDLTVENDKTFVTMSGIFVYDTFHSTGVGGVTLGVTRANELLSVTQKIKTPQSLIQLTPEVNKDNILSSKISNSIKHIVFEDIVDSLEVIYDPNPSEDGSIMKKDNVDSVYYSTNPSKNACQKDIKGLDWLLRIKLDKVSTMEKNITMLDIKSKFCKKWENKGKKGSKGKSGAKSESSILKKIDHCAILSNDDNSKKLIVHVRFSMKAYNMMTIVKFSEYVINFKLKGLSGVKNTIGNFSTAKNIKFDEQGEMYHDNVNYIATEGINMKDIRYINGIDLDKTTCNDINIVYKMFGIEAVRKLLIKELDAVFDGGMNYHHLAIIIDIMTNTGNFTKINMSGYNEMDADPIKKASFEKTVQMLIDASVEEKIDKLSANSARIALGLPIAVGTGIVKSVLNVDLINQSANNIDEYSNKLSSNQLSSSNIIEDILQNESITDIFLPN